MCCSNYTWMYEFEHWILLCSTNSNRLNWQGRCNMERRRNLRGKHRKSRSIVIGNELRRSFVRYFVGVELRNFRSDNFYGRSDCISCLDEKSNVVGINWSSRPVGQGERKNKIDPSIWGIVFPARLFPLKIPKRKIEFEKFLLCFIRSVLILRE